MDRPLKTLYLIRHAKSDWDTPFLSDWHRQLSKRGQKNAVSLAKLLKKRNIYIQKALVSDAKRSRATFDILRNHYSFVKKAVHTNGLYESDRKQIEAIISAENDSIESLLVVGHNPGMEDFASFLLSPANHHSPFFKFPTATLAIFAGYAHSWQELILQQAGLRFFWIPNRSE